jgi:8-hydroxy-5-deazaflavin:NADPH oxidoreductase
MPYGGAFEQAMKIGVIGSGRIGGTVARLFVEAGHQVMVANSRGPLSLLELVRQVNHGVRAGDVEVVARFGALVLVAIPFASYRDLPAQALAGKPVIDAMNYYP